MLVATCRGGGRLDYSVWQYIKSFEASAIGIFTDQFVIGHINKLLHGTLCSITSEVLIFGTWKANMFLQN